MAIYAAEWQKSTQCHKTIIFLYYFFFFSPRIEDVSDIKLIRTDTTLDLSQKAEKRSTIIFQLKIKFFKIFEKLQKNKLGCFVPFLDSRLISQKFSKTELSNLFFF